MESNKPVNDGQKTSEVDTVRVLLGTIGDTTWRMFVPSVGFTLLGVWLDRVFVLKPWLMIAGIVIGFASASLLVRLQISRIKASRSSSHPGSNSKNSSKEATK